MYHGGLFRFRQKSTFKQIAKRFEIATNVRFTAAEIAATGNEPKLLYNPPAATATAKAATPAATYDHQRGWTTAAATLAKFGLEITATSTVGITAAATAWANCQTKCRHKSGNS